MRTNCDIYVFIIFPICVMYIYIYYNTQNMIGHRLLQCTQFPKKQVYSKKYSSIPQNTTEIEQSLR